MAKMVCRIAKDMGVRFIAHLDTQRLLQRALRRSGLPVAYSKGFNPHAQLSFALALPLGYTSAGEYVTIALEEELSPKDFMRGFAPHLPPGFTLLACGLFNGKPGVSELMHAASYTVALPQPERLEQSIARMLASEEILTEKKGKAGVRSVDIRPMIHGMRAQADALHLCLHTSAGGALSPSLLLPLLLCGTPLEDAPWVARREDLLTQEFTSVLDAAAHDVARAPENA